METTTLSLRQAVLGDLEPELATTRRVLERIPEEHLAWKPHQKSMSLGALALHVANLLRWQTSILQEDGLDLGALPPRAAPPERRAEVLEAFDRNHAALKEALAEVDEAAFGRTYTLRRGEHVIWQQPKAAALRGAGISHMIHHRGQLCVYLRLLDVPVPATYGPSADEQA